MKKLKTPIFIMGISALLFSLTANAQKLPNVQPSTGLRVPANIKIDGKTTEWDNSFQAYNHATDVFYTIANDDEKLYLIVQATDKAIVNKIIGGGVTFTIQKSGKKNEKDAVSITYPLFDAKDRPYVRGGGGAPGGMRVVTFGGPGGGGGGDLASSMAAATTVIKNGDATPNANAKTEGDSIMNVYNKRLDDKSKNIGVIGIPGLDTLISVYNEDGIRVAERFNTKMDYTYELSIDLKKLGLSVSDATKLAYHIKVNAAKMGEMKINIQGSPGAAADPAMQARIQQMMTQLSASSGGETTDFWGEYTLAKK